MAIVTPGREVDDLQLVAALLRMGCKLDEALPARTMELRGGRGPKYVFYFKERSACGRWETAFLVKRWDDVGWMEAHPEHPWAYLWGMAVHYRRVLNFVKAQPPLVEIEHGGLVGFLGANASQEVGDKFFDRLADLKRKGKRSRMFDSR